MSPELTAAKALVTERLPLTSRWRVLGHDMDWAFTGSWRRFHGEAFGLDDAEAVALRPFIVFGEYTFNGGAAPMVGLHETDGTVHGIDVERDGELVFWFNSSLAAFVETFALLDSLLWNPNATLPPGLRDDVERIDPVGFDRSDWAGLLRAMVR